MARHFHSPGGGNWKVYVFLPQSPGAVRRGAGAPDCPCKEGSSSPGAGPRTFHFGGESKLGGSREGARERGDGAVGKSGPPGCAQAGVESAAGRGVSV